MATDKTYIAVRPGYFQQAQAAFGDLDVEVDDTLTVDYEFRQRPLSMLELLEQETDDAERAEADPKNAATYIVPLLIRPDDSDEYVRAINHCEFLVVRVEATGSYRETKHLIKGFEPTIHQSMEQEVNVAASIGKLRGLLKDNDINVFSISEADGLTFSAL